MNDKNFFLRTKVFSYSIEYAEKSESAFQGKGAFGKVLRVFDANLNKDIAIKMIKIKNENDFLADDNQN